MDDKELLKLTLGELLAMNNMLQEQVELVLFLVV